MITDKEIQQEIYQYCESLKDSCSILYRNPRIIGVEANLDMEIFGLLNYIEVDYALQDIVPGNDFKWHEDKHMTLVIEFQNRWVDFKFGMEYNSDQLEKLMNLVDRYDLSVYIPKKSEDEEGKEKEDLDQLVREKHVTKRTDFFIVSGLTIHNTIRVKEFIQDVSTFLHDEIFV